MKQINKIQVHIIISEKTSTQLLTKIPRDLFLYL